MQTSLQTYTVYKYPFKYTLRNQLYAYQLHGLYVHWNSFSGLSSWCP